MGYEHIRIEESERSATLTLERPPELMELEDPREGIRARLAGREPRWSHR